HIVDYSPANFLFIASLGLLGMVLSIRRWKGLSLLYIFIISYSISIIIFFVISRYRLPMTPILSIFAASALYWLWMKISEKRYLPLLPSIALLALFTVLVGKDIPWLTDLNRHEVLYREGFDFETKGDYDRAETKYMEAARVSPQSYAAHFGLGEVYTIKKRPHAAVNEYRLAVQAMPMSALARFKLGMAYIDTGSSDEAIREFQASIELVSGQPQSYYGLGAAFEKKGMPDEAVRYWEEYLRRDSEGEWSSLVRSRIEAIRGKAAKQ
ncbi:MAG: tetratricopeptide repeat protein, partial [Deltaproteobacteria bacterium]